MALTPFWTTITKPATAAPFTQAVTGFGYRPNVVFGVTIAALAHSFNTTLHYGLGFSDGTDDFSIFLVSGTGFNPGGSLRRQASALFCPYDQVGANPWTAEVSSFDADGLTLNWTANNGTNNQICLLLGLDGVQAKVGTFNTPGATGSQSITGVGFQPDFIWLLTTGLSGAAAAGTAGTSAKLSSGWGTPTATVCASMREENGVSPSNTHRQLTNARILSVLNTTADTEGDGATLTSLDAGGFTLNWVAHASSAFTVGYLALGRVFAKVGTETARTTSTGTKATTGMGFQPEMLFNTNVGTTMTALGLQTGAVFHLGAYGSTGFLSGGTSRNAQVATDTDRRILTTHSVSHQIENGAQATAANVSSLDADGFTLNWTTVTANAEQFGYLGLKEDPIRPSSGGVFLRRRRR